MNALDDWPRIKRVLEQALERDGAEREAYVAGACGADARLRALVERLLAAGEYAEGFLETPAVVLLREDHRQDLSGRGVSSYQLLSLLGTGGMSEVYLAHDSKLDRPVAIKFLSKALAADRHRLQRFHQEARAASSLNHPNIVVVHDFGEFEGRPYIVTEFIDGETLRQRLRRGVLPAGDVVDIGIQVASALAAAHARGLAHLDIKPENVMLRRDGYVKVLDFGLATLATTTPPADQADLESRPRTGIVSGTPRYMSPEQARGLDLDPRSDVWSFGVVLHEMATGRLPVAAGQGGGAASDRNLPADLQPIVGKALHNGRDRRQRSGAELCADLKEVQRERAAGQARTGARTLTVGALLATAAVVLVGVASMHRSRATVAEGTQKTVAVLPFDKIDGDSDLDYLRLALADEVATALSGAPSLAVRPMAAARRFDGRELSAQQAGQQLRVGKIVIGHFSTHQFQLHVVVEAVDVDANRLLWRETIEAPASDPIALRDRLTSMIHSGLLPVLSAIAPTAAPARPRNADAYAIYLRSLGNSSDPGPNRNAIAMLERASLLEPTDADTWTSLADRYYYEGHYGGGGSDALRHSEAAARQALALDPTRMSAAVRLYNLQVEAGRLQDGFDSAFELTRQHPNSGEAHFALSYVLRYGGLLGEASRECEQAVSRDSTNPLFRSCASPLMVLARYDRALDFVRLDGDSEWARLVTRFIYQRMGRRDDARRQHERLPPTYLRSLAPEMFYGLLSRCLAGAPPDQQGRVTDDDVTAFLNVREDPEPLYYWAADLAYCGHTAPALQLLRESLRRNFCGVAAIETDPAFAAIRSSAGYDEFLRDAHACRARFLEHVRVRANGSPLADAGVR